MPATTIDFGEIDHKLHAFLDAVAGDRTKHVKRAVNEYIDRELDGNVGYKARFDEALAIRLNKAGTNVSSLQPKRGRGRPPKSTQQVNPAVEAPTNAEKG